jgi:hypothetical protein
LRADAKSFHPLTDRFDWPIEHADIFPQKLIHAAHEPNFPCAVRDGDSANHITPVCHTNLEVPLT